MARPRIAYLGPPGTYSDEAAQRHDPNAERVPAPTIGAAARAVIAGDADQAVVPIENSLEGSVTETLDLLIHEIDLRIHGEIIVPISHCLLAPPDTPAAAIHAVYSHPQALAQCRRYLARRLPGVETVAALSTVQAVETIMVRRHGAAAIAPRGAAALHGAVILDEAIQDDPRNQTRFVVLTSSDAPPSGYDKTSLAFNVRDRPGTLFQVLRHFADAGINLTKIESRPSREALGVYVFLVDLTGHRLDPSVAAVLEQVAQETTTLKILGSYPRDAGA